MTNKEFKELEEFENHFSNCGYTISSKPNTGFRLREAIKRVEELGRPLTKEEAKKFEHPLN